MRIRKKEEVYFMAFGKISKKQQEILEFIKEEILNKGYPPAVREICEAVNLKSTSSVHSHLETLEKNGYIRRDPTKPRAIEVIDDQFNLVRRETVNIPLVGTVAAGQPILAQANIENYFPLPSEYAPSNQAFMLRVKGDSMIRAGIPVIWFWSNRERMSETEISLSPCSVTPPQSKPSTKSAGMSAFSRRMRRWSRSS